MSLNHYIKSASHTIYSQLRLKTETPLSISTAEELSELVSSALANKTYKFSETERRVLNQNGHKRIIKQFNNTNIIEQVLCLVVKWILDRNFKIQYPNRNKICRSLFDILPSAVRMHGFTIVRFDFKNYFNSVSSQYVFHKYISPKISSRDEYELISNYVDNTEYAFAGLRPSNSIAEIIAKAFDNELQILLRNEGLIFYERYIDDTIIILNKSITQADIDKYINIALQKVYYDKRITKSRDCKRNSVCLNRNKYQYLSTKTFPNPSKQKFNFLGYEFQIEKNNTQKKAKGYTLTYGITQEKRDKSLRRIMSLIRSCQKPNSTELMTEDSKLILLHHRLRNFISRQVYVKDEYQSHTWKVKGFITNYGELRFKLGTNQIDSDTVSFLEDSIKQAFEKLNISNPPPYVNSKCFNLSNHMSKNRTILLHPRIGYSLQSLRKLCDEIAIPQVNEKTYQQLVREYLIKVKVGY